MPKFYLEMFLDVDDAWRFHVMAGNGNIIASSEAYSSKQACQDTCLSLADLSGLVLIIREKD